MLTKPFGFSSNTTSWDLKTPCQTRPHPGEELRGDFDLVLVLPAALRKALHALKSEIFTSYAYLSSATLNLGLVALTLKGKTWMQFPREELRVGRREALLPSILTTFQLTPQ